MPILEPALDISGSSIAPIHPFGTLHSALEPLNDNAIRPPVLIRPHDHFDTTSIPIRIEAQYCPFGRSAEDPIKLRGRIYLCRNWMNNYRTSISRRVNSRLEDLSRASKNKPERDDGQISHPVNNASAQGSVLQIPFPLAHHACGDRIAGTLVALRPVVQDLYI